MLAAFLIDNPRVTLHLGETNRRIDVIAEGVDVAIRARVPPLQDSDLIVKVLGKRAWCLVASPSLLDRYPAPTVPADLITLPTLDQGPPRPEHVWQFEGPDGAGAAVRHTPRLVTDDMSALRAAVAGAGIASLTTMMKQRAAGRRAGESPSVMVSEVRHHPRRVSLPARIAARSAPAHRFPGGTLPADRRSVAGRIGPDAQIPPFSQSCNRFSTNAIVRFHPKARRCAWA